jgi:hypothetical protein
VQLFEALAPLRVMQLERLTIFSPLQLGSPEVEALAHSLGDSTVYLKLMGCTLLSSFWGPLAQRLPHLQELTLGYGVAASVTDLVLYLSMRSPAQPDSLRIVIYKSALGEAGVAELQTRITPWQLRSIRLLPV